MKYFLLFVLSFLSFVSVSANAIDLVPNDWTKTNTVLEEVYGASLIVDLGTTLDIKNHKGYEESNLILGTNPKDNQVYEFFVVNMAVQYLIATMLEPDSRLIFQGWTIATEFNAIVGNYRVGLSMKF